MRNNWYRDISFFKNEKDLVSKSYPDLYYIQVDDKIKLKGELYIKEIDDAYSIEIDFLDDYPNSLPLVREVDNDIPKIEDRHIYNNGTCCLCIPQLEKYYFPKGSNIKDFLDKLVVPFFANQAYYEITGKWINGEYSHEYLGIYEFYRDFFGEKDIDKILDLLKVITKSVPNFNKKCPCLSGKSIKKCHMKKILKIKELVEINQIKRDILNLK